MTHFVTKEYLDDKLADFKADNRNFHLQLLEVLASKQIISAPEHQ
jgi:hypothetical protein